MIRLGLTLRAEADPRHIWIVLSDPAESPDGAILLVNLTTFTEKCADDCCILSPPDYPVLKHKTVVGFSRAKKGFATPLETAISWASS